MTPEERITKIWADYYGGANSIKRSSMAQDIIEAIRAAVAEEREACAKIAERHAEMFRTPLPRGNGYYVARDIESTICARKDTKVTAKIVQNPPAKLNGEFADPLTLLVVGIDPIPPGIDAADVADLEDERVKYPIKRGLVDSIKLYGVTDTVTCRSHRSTSGDRATYNFVVNGRQRVRAARKANEELKADKGELVQVPFVRRKEANEINVIVSNEHRTFDPPMVKARKAAWLVRQGHSKKHVAICFADQNNGHAVSLQTIDNWLKLLKLSPEDQARVDGGTLPLSEAYALASPSKVNGHAEPSEGGPVRDPKPRAPGSKPTPKALAALADTYAPSETEEYDHPWEAPVGALLEWIVTGDPSGLLEWPSLHDQCVKVVRPSARVGKEAL